MEEWASEILKTVPKAVVGARLRRERLAQGVSLRDLAGKAKVGVNSVVRLENGTDFRLTTLIKVCAALGVHLDRLANSSDEAVAIHRRADDRWHELDSYSQGFLAGGSGQLSEDERRQAVANSGENPVMLLKSRLASGKLLPTYIEIHNATEPRSHPGEEFVYVVRGSLHLTIAGEQILLHEGESIDFWGSELHSYGPASDQPCAILSLRISP